MLAVLLVQNGITDILDFGVKNFTFDFPVGTPLRPEYRNLGDAMERTGRYLYPVDIDQSDYENPRTFEVDPAFYSESMIDGNWGAFLTVAQSVDSGVVDYYFNKRTGQRIDAFSDMRGDVIAIDPTGEGSSYFRVKFTKDGTPVFLSILVSHEKWFMAWVPVLSILAMAATAGGAAGWLGGAVLGAETAAAYPLIAETIGKVMISTIATGGDVAGSVTKLASTLAGGYFGDVIGTGLDSQVIGTLAESAITAAISGEDISLAVGQSLFQLGLKMDFEFEDFGTPTVGGDFGTSFDDMSGIDFGTVPGTSFDDLTALADIGVDASTFEFSDWMLSNEDVLIDQGLSLDSLAVDTSGNLYFADGQYVELSPPVYADSFYADIDGNVRSPDNQIILTASDAQSMNDAQIAGAIYQDWQSKQGTVAGSLAAPPDRPDIIPPPASQTKVPTMLDYAATFERLLNTGVSIYQKIRAISSGVYSPLPSAYPGGVPRVQAVGVPVAQADGSTITNNGNGTQTIRRPDGTTDTIRTYYSGQTNAGGILAGVSTQTLLIGGAVLLGALLIAKRK